MAPADQPDEILRKDPRLSQQVPSVAGLSRHDHQLIDTVSRYVAGTKTVELAAVLDRAACVVPGSYAADIRATAKLSNGEAKQFSILHVKRYDRTLLDRTMENEGWEPLGHWRYGADYHGMWLLLYRRCRQPERPQTP